MVIHVLMVSWYPRRRFGNPTGNVMMDLEPWGSPGVVEVIEETHEDPCLIKKALTNHFDPYTRWFNGLEEMKMIWAFGVLEPLGMVLGNKKGLTPTYMVAW